MPVVESGWMTNGGHAELGHRRAVNTSFVCRSLLTMRRLSALASRTQRSIKPNSECALIEQLFSDRRFADPGVRKYKHSSEVGDIK
jgi:hypothetical protein